MYIWNSAIVCLQNSHNANAKGMHILSEEESFLCTVLCAIYTPVYIVCLGFHVFMCYVFVAYM